MGGTFAPGPPKTTPRGRSARGDMGGYASIEAVRVATGPWAEDWWPELGSDWNLAPSLDQVGIRGQHWSLKADAAVAGSEDEIWPERCRFPNPRPRKTTRTQEQFNRPTNARQAELMQNPSFRPTRETASD